MNGLTLMIQGSSSSVGKSLLVAALCRIFVRRGIRVAPFKAQNMSNNAAVCPDGSEIGRSQAVQAAAARIKPTVAINPILLKPEADSRSQVIVSGRPWRTLDARHYFAQREALWPIVVESLDSLRQEFELVIMEGAGSPAELNLRGADLVNMAVARFANSPVLLVGDIDRGGVFAQLLGTLALLEPQDRRLVRGLVVNKFRGDPSLFDAGRAILEQRSGLPVLGVVPWISNLNLPEEDGQPLEYQPSRLAANNKIDIAVIQLPRIANFDDFDPLQGETEVAVRYVRSPDQLGQPHAIVLPGTKSTIADLQWLRAIGLAERIVQLAARGTPVVGICGGYQMQGQQIVDPDQVESSCTEIAGLGLLPHHTVFSRTKTTHVVQAEITDDRHCPGCAGQLIEAYEIHMGRSSGHRGWLKITQRSGNCVSEVDGAVSDDGRVWGCYLHGLFANYAFRMSWLDSVKTMAARKARVDRESPDRSRPNTSLDTKLDELVDHIEAAIDMDHLYEILNAGHETRRSCSA